MPDPYVNLAHKAIESLVKEGKILKIPDNLPKEMLKKKAGVFVSIHKKPPEPARLEYPSKIGSQIMDGVPEKEEKLRGCIGTFLPTQENIAYEIIANAVAAATRDPRFQPVSPDELAHLEISVDILSSPQPATIKEINPKKYGLIVRSADGRLGLLLPDIPSVDTKEQQIQIAKEKAFIGEDEPVKLFRFTVERHKD